MKYIILNNKDFFEDKINLKQFEEVTDEKDRCDAIFGEIDEEILEQLYSDEAGGDRILQNKWLLRDGGVSFILLKINKGILHDNSGKLIKKLIGLHNKESHYIEIWSDHDPKTYKEIECYLFAYNKQFGYINNILPKKIENNDLSIFENLLKEIHENLL